MSRMIYKQKSLAFQLLACCAVLSASSTVSVAQQQVALNQAEELSGSVGRGAKNAAADVLAVQIALNQIPADQGGAMEEMLVPDGTVGPLTIAAIERFQRKQFDDKNDGRIEPNGPTVTRLNELLAAQSLKQRIVQVALGEELFWQSGRFAETDAAVSKRLKDYWAAVGQDFSEDQLQSAEFQNQWPWSAAFVSWVMKRAGAGEQFNYSAAHRIYTSAAKHNRLEKNENRFKAFRVAETSPQVGGIVVNGRGGSVVKYDNVDNGAPHKTHGDIVVAIKEEAVIVVGGNVGNSVRTTTVPLDDAGHLEPKMYFAVIVIEDD